MLHDVSSKNIQSFLKIQLHYIIGFYDDVEVTNPLGLKMKKQSRLFYFVHANIGPHLKSQLQCIAIFGVCKMKDLKQYGIDKLVSFLLLT